MRLWMHYEVWAFQSIEALPQLKVKVLHPLGDVTETSPLAAEVSDAVLAGSPVEMGWSNAAAETAESVLAVI